MKKYLLIILTLTLNLAHGQLAFQSGEKLSYVVSYRAAGFITANVGAADMTVSDTTYLNNSALIIKAEAYTLPFFRWFFDMRDIYTTYVETENFRPLSARADIRQGNYLFRSVIDFNWQDMQAVSRYRNLKRTTDKHKTLELTPESYDGLTLFYNLRSKNKEDFIIGQEHNLQMVLENKIHNVKYKYLGEDEVKIKRLGTFKALKFSCEMATSSGESFEDGTEAFIWISDDKNHIILKAKSPIKVGSVVARITDFKSLKYPLDSKIK